MRIFMAINTGDEKIMRRLGYPNALISYWNLKDMKRDRLEKVAFGPPMDEPTIDNDITDMEEDPSGAFEP